jgi:hypothetical protein
MAPYKNQHYLPEFYFAFFSKDHLSIEMHNINSNIVKTKGYKKLCSDSYFYASIPDFELNIHDLEIRFNDAIQKLISGGRLEEQEYIYMLFFVSFQHARTKKEKLRSEYFWDKMSKAMLKESLFKHGFQNWRHGDPYISSQFIDDCTIKSVGLGSSSTSHMFYMYLALESTILLIDLMPRILINNTTKDFIFSDNPIVLYNKYFYGKRKYLATGFGSPGLQIFCPLSPRVMLMLYDDECYSFGHNNPIIIIMNRILIH